MRIWSVHPEYLDVKGLVALWRETLLAQKVLQGATKGYKNHPQLQRFKASTDPIQYISNYLHLVCDEATQRNYNFNRQKIVRPYATGLNAISVTQGQLDYEWQHLSAKLRKRDPILYETLSAIKNKKINVLFHVIDGEIEPWEIV